ncbi:hypothetical protein C7999DRAFT_42483 [Corynascus novoguineensis]|uniref:Uncharacterized protein n=1 Tax=Corynascus novoguineensis TaxID=1126955 RepID=A0AAN7HHR7_9PEZI|nr:hypothetical protein C7999DRAFT_42483 [Corynascus novoguineensis]
MPSTIPYNPSLVLGSIVDKSTIDTVEKIAELQADPDAEQAKLNALISLKQSLEMTRTELMQLGIDPESDEMEMLTSKMAQLDKDLATTAKEYCSKKITAEENIAELRKDIKAVNSSVESPIDYVKTQIKTMPLAADSVNMDVQYFARDENNQSAESFASAVKGFVAGSLSHLGSRVSTEMGGASGKQVAGQVSNHSIVGTLVLSVSCTHKNASILAPLILNVDKAVKTWNHLFAEDKLSPTSGKAMSDLANSDEKGENKFSIISGMTYGSSFVGMVHILNTTDTSVSESISSAAASLQAQMDTGAWFEKASGGFGVSTTFSNSVKNLLSTQNVSSHVTVICMGAIPSMVASEVKLAVEKFAKFDPQENMNAISTIQNATAAEKGTVDQAAQAARTGGQMVSMKATEIKSALSALAEIDDGNNKILDVNSMMTALDDYLKKAADGSAGVPINYYLKDITKEMIAEMWVAKYYPGKYMAIQWDDSKSKSGGGENGESGEGSGSGQ